MAHYQGTVTTARSPESVFDYLASFDSVAEWDPGVERARKLDPEGPGPGARYEVVARFLGREVPLVYRTTEFERPRRVVLRAETATVVSNDVISFEPLADGGTLVTYEADLILKGAMRVAELPMRLAFRRIGDRARAGLEQALSHQPAAR